MYKISEKTFMEIWNKTEETIRNTTPKKEYIKYKDGNTITYKKGNYYEKDKIEVMLIIRRKIK